MCDTDGCRFCNISKGNFAFLGVDEPVLSNERYFAIASVGALVEGWTLIVPRSHHYSMSSAYSDPLFSELVSSLISKMLTRFDRIIAFEHGAKHEGSLTACGTEHAHLHLVPFSESLMDEMEKTGLYWEKSSARDLISINSEYLFYSEINKNQKSSLLDVGFVHSLENPISQFFRKIIAKKIKKEDVSDYKKYPLIEESTRTSNMLRELLKSE